MTIVVDASAVLAMIFGETGGDIVLGASRDAMLSAVNFDEVLHKVTRRGMPPAVIEDQLQRLGMTIIPFDVDQARISAELHGKVAGTDTSFADRACLSLAIKTRLPALTADAKWQTLGLDIDIRLIR